MTPETVFAKSPKALEEIETRAHKLGSRLRQALIRIDGMKTVDELLGEAGEMGEALLGQIEELERQGYLTEVTSRAEVIEVPAPQPAAAPAGHALPPVAAKPEAPTKPSAPPESVEFNSPVKFRVQDLLVEALGLDTGKAGAALNRCRNREDLARWVELAVAPIEQSAGKAKAKAFHTQAKKLVGG